MLCSERTKRRTMTSKGKVDPQVRAEGDRSTAGAMSKKVDPGTLAFFSVRKALGRQRRRMLRTPPQYAVGAGCGGARRARATRQRGVKVKGARPGTGTGKTDATGDATGGNGDKDRNRNDKEVM